MEQFKVQLALRVQLAQLDQLVRKVRLDRLDHKV